MGISAIWKAKIRAALKGHWLTALLIALVYNLPSLLVRGIAVYTGNDLMTRLTELLYGAVSASGTVVEAEKLTSGMDALLADRGIWIMQGLNLVAMLLTPCLALGLYAWLQGRLRNQEDPGVTAVFSRIRCFFRAIGLQLYIIWRIFLWMLPGLGLSVASMLPLWLSDSSSRISVLSAANTTVGLQSAAMVVTAVLGVMAALKYRLGDLIMAEQPEIGPIRAAKESKRLMKGKRGMLCLLYLSFVFWLLLESLVTSFADSAFGAIPALMIQLLASLAITMYLNGTVTAFYLDLRAADQGQQEGFQKDENGKEEPLPWEKESF